MILEGNEFNAVASRSLSGVGHFAIGNYRGDSSRLSHYGYIYLWQLAEEWEFPYYWAPKINDYWAWGIGMYGLLGIEIPMQLGTGDDDDEL